MGGECGQIDSRAGKEAYRKGAKADSQKTSPHVHEKHLGKDQEDHFPGSHSHGLHDPIFPEVLENEDDKDACDAECDNSEDQDHHDAHGDIVQVDKLNQIRHQFLPGFEGTRAREHAVVSAHDRRRIEAALEEHGGDPGIALR